jgi:hypothetical protein
VRWRHLPTFALLACMLSAGLCACDDAAVGGGPSSTSDAAAAELTLADFVDGAWLLHVDRTLRPGGPDPSVPTQSLSEQDYVAAAKPSERKVVVSMQAQRVSIGDTPWLGTRTLENARQLSFDLGSGTFAGGRFVVWQAAHGLQAELTIYGSGLPIVQSERGALLR